MGIFLESNLISFFVYNVNKTEFIVFVIIYIKQYQQSLVVILIDLQTLQLKRTMMIEQFQHSFSVDQEKKILQEIHSINKRLNSNPYSGRHIVLGQSIKSQTQEQKYFSQQCDQLFNDNNYPQIKKNQDTFDESLFSSKNEMLLDNLYEKEVKNFKEFQTYKFSSQNKNQNELLFNKDSKNRIKFSPKPPTSNQFPINERVSITSQCSTERRISQSSRIQQTKSKSRIKSIAQSKIKKYIQNKQNILPASNIQQHQQGKQSSSSFIKQVSRKIRFQTQPDSGACLVQEQDSLQPQKYEQQLYNNISKSKSRVDTHRSSLECTFKPSILKKSSQIAQNMQPSFERLTQDISVPKSQSKLPYKAKDELTAKKYSMKRLQQLSKPRKLKTLVDQQQQKYDFRPSLSKKSLEQMASCTMDVAQRNKLWLQQKQAKISKLKVEEQQKKIKQQIGSYAPKITPYRGEKQVHLSRYAKQGISSYFERLSMAKHKNNIPNQKKQQQKQQIKDSNVVLMKKKTYDDAVKELHQRILAMNL